MEAGSSPARITSRRTGTPLTLSSGTPAATSARTSAATALPSRNLATVVSLKDREELGGDLLLAAHHAGEVYDTVLGPAVEGALDRGAVAGAQELGAALDDVRDHERREDVAVLRAQVLQSVEQLVLALQEVDPDGLHLGDAHLLPRASAVLLGIAVHDLLHREVRDVRGGLEHPRTKLLGVQVEHPLQVLDDLTIALGRGRRVEDDRVREHGREQHSGRGSLRLQPARLEALDDQGRRRSYGIKGGGDRGIGFDVADAVMVQDLDYPRLLHALDALPDLSVVHEDHAPGVGVEQIRTGYHAYGHLVVHGYGRPVVDLHHALGYLG